MALIRLSAKHGKTLEEARGQLQSTVDEIRSRFGNLVQRIAWSADQNNVKLYGPGVEIELSVDAEEVHVIGDVPLLRGLLGRSFTQGLQSILQRNFQRRLA